MSPVMALAGWVPALAALAALGLLQGCAGPGTAADRSGDVMSAADRRIIVAVHDRPPRWRPRAGSTARPYRAGGPYRGSPEARRMASSIADAYDLVPVASWPIRLLDLHCVVYEVQGERSREEVIKAVAAKPGVAIAQPMQEFTTLEAAAVGPAGDHLPADGVRLDLELAHRWSQGRGVEVAVIDTSVDRDHPGLAGRIARQLDFVGSREDPGVEGRHGTAVAGVIAAGTHVQLGVLGVAPEARLAVLQACWQTSPTEAMCNSFTLAQAITAAVELEAGVINLSLTGPPDPLLERLLRAAIARNRVVIGALPPGSSSHGVRRFPTSVDGVIRVQMAEDHAAGNPGALLAPGLDVLTLEPGGRYGRASGSSLAAAHVSGIVALLLERDRKLDPARAHSLLASHSRLLRLEDDRSVLVVSACDSLASLLDGRCGWPAESAGGLAAPSGATAGSGTARRWR